MGSIYLEFGFSEGRAKGKGAQEGKLFSFLLSLLLEKRFEIDNMFEILNDKKCKENLMMTVSFPNIFFLIL